MAKRDPRQSLHTASHCESVNECLPALKPSGQGRGNRDNGDAIRGGGFRFTVSPLENKLGPPAWDAGFHTYDRTWDIVGA